MTIWIVLIHRVTRPLRHRITRQPVQRDGKSLDGPRLPEAKAFMGLDAEDRDREQDQAGRGIYSV